MEKLRKLTIFLLYYLLIIVMISLSSSIMVGLFVISIFAVGIVITVYLCVTIAKLIIKQLKTISK